LKIAMG